MAKQKVALECLSYHATASQDQTIKLAHEPVKSAEDYKLYSFKFIGERLSRAATQFKVLMQFPLTDFELAEEETCRATIRMFVDFNLTSQFHIPYEVSHVLTLSNYVPLRSINTLATKQRYYLCRLGPVPMDIEC